MLTGTGYHEAMELPSEGRAKPDVSSGIGLPIGGMQHSGVFPEGSVMKFKRSITSLASLRDRLREFARERDWDQYHTPKNLSMALIGEAAELVEHFQWVDGQESHLLSDGKRESVEEELADILIYLVRISDKLNVDLYQAAERKILINEKKYPAEKVRGSARKYTEYED
jgi:NTP pyrophosphatase (non-canonical NTP hydrolase)